MSTEWVEIMRDRAFMKRRILWDDGDRISHPAEAELAHIDAIDLNFPATRLHKAEEREETIKRIKTALGVNSNDADE